MRPLEALVTAVVLLACSLLFRPAARRSRRACLVPAAGVVVAAVQLGFEGFRWQMVPAYALTGALFLATLRGAWLALRPGKHRATIDRKRTRLAGAATSLAMLAICAAIPVLFPHFELPGPTGPYAVGTIDLHLVDARRAEPFTPDPDDSRELAVRLWYPAGEVAGARPVSYGEHAREIGRILTRDTPLPPFVLDGNRWIDTHAYRGVALASAPERFPILLFSHAYWAGLLQSSVLMEELASHGYVVASVAHSYETPYTIEPGGRIRAFDPRNPELQARAEERRRGLGLEDRIVRTTDPVELEAQFRELARRRPQTLASLRLWVADLVFVADELARLNDGPGPFRGRLDTETIGVLGHSFGGSAAGQACLGDPRFKAGVNLDGLQIGDALDEGIDRPFMFVHHDNPFASNETPNRLIFERAGDAAPAYLLVVRGTRHPSFSDLSLYGRGSLMRLSGALGTLDGRRCLRIQNDYVRAFFDKHLRGRDSRLLDGPSEAYPEVEIRVRRPGAAPARS